MSKKSEAKKPAPKDVTPSASGSTPADLPFVSPDPVSTPVNSTADGAPTLASESKPTDPETLDNSAPPLEDMQHPRTVTTPRLPFGLPYRLSVQGSAEMVAMALYAAANTIGSAYKRAPVRDALLNTIHAAMVQLTKVARPRSSYGLHLVAAASVSPTVSFAIDVRFHEFADACPPKYESMRAWEKFVQTQSREAASGDDERERAALGAIDDVLRDVEGD